METKVHSATWCKLKNYEAQNISGSGMSTNCKRKQRNHGTVFCYKLRKQKQDNPGNNSESTNKNWSI